MQLLTGFYVLFYQKPCYLDDSITHYYMNISGGPENEVDPNEECRIVLKNQIGQISLLHAPTVDCVDPKSSENYAQNMDGFISLKTYKIDENNYQRFKLGHIWADNQLTGIPRIIVGERKNGKVENLELLTTDDLPGKCEGQWDPNVCFNLLTKILNFVEERVLEKPGTTFKFQRSKDEIKCSQLSGEDDINLLPDSYTNGLFP
ncbi:decapping and exoribonuclease protein-like [Macrobrachium rosenbergii]|uniref:decapping and exoribonuclease protein-like n=1 Tax=Macrobrachium rosenbergii TaxID=79674 RepID=UPI0034D54969